MTRLSVNINKIATIRNARGGNLPDVTKAALNIERFGAEGITVHPRPDERHIRYSDVREIRPLLKTEFNIEGNPIPSFIDLVSEVVPDQVTLVPDAQDAITSNAGWDKRHLGRVHFAHQVAEARDGVAFYVEFGGQQGFERPHVRIADVPLVGPVMDRDSLGAEALAIDGCLEHIGDISAACVAQRGDFIDVYT